MAPAAFASVPRTPIEAPTHTPARSERQPRHGSPHHPGSTATNSSTYLVASRSRLAISTSLSSTAIRQISCSITVQNLPELSTTSRSDFAGAPTYSTY